MENGDSEELFFSIDFCLKKPIKLFVIKATVINISNSSVVVETETISCSGEIIAFLFFLLSFFLSLKENSESKPFG